MLTVIGDLVEDIVVWTDGPSRRGTDNPATVTRSRGGSAANVAARSAALTATRFIGRVGDDPAGGSLSEALAAVGVDVRVQQSGRTGTVVIVVDPVDGERTMYPDRAAAAELGPVESDWLTGTTMLHVPAYGFLTDPAADSIRRAIVQARASGARLSIDVSAVTVVSEYGREQFLDLLDEVEPDVVLANADEAAALDLADQRPDPGAVFVIKDGPHPATVLLDDGSVHQVAPPPVDQVRDTTGAGDAFAAGFLAATMAGSGPVDACTAGHRSAAVVLSAPGAG